MTSYRFARAPFLFGLGLTVLSALAPACGGSDKIDFVDEPAKDTDAGSNTTGVDAHVPEPSDTGSPEPQKDSGTTEPEVDAGTDAATDDDAASEQDASTIADASDPSDASSGDASTCSNGKKDGTEADVDCGGDCPTKCDDSKWCIRNSDCKSGKCLIVCIKP